ncbi:MAG TPA: SDR family NAD(P)-dependent oxidoreductase [Actinomycetota bacterium]|nr:SDR family NAD(P)-dependent oxidoreductase [Actinomycetota bacterium]
MRSIVTGAARGLGERIAVRLAVDGGDVALIDVDDDVVSIARRLEAEAGGARVIGVRCDVSDEAAVASTLSQVLAHIGGLDLLVNNAGIGGPSTEVRETDVASFRRVIDVNLVGSFLMARACARVMVEAGSGGAIVNLGSIFGQQGVANGAGYCASKGGITLLTHSLALELAPHGIRVNTIAPGNMLTDMHLEDLRVSASGRGASLEDEVERVRATVPLGRHGTGDDIAGAVAWLASDDASYVTGQTIGVNGGVVLT